MIKLFGKKQIDAANKELSDRMETKKGKTVKSIAIKVNIFERQQ